MKLSSKKVALALPLPFMAMNVPSAIAAKKTAPTPQERPNIIYLIRIKIYYDTIYTSF